MRRRFSKGKFLTCSRAHNLKLEPLEGRCLLSAAGVWTIVGDANPQALDDEILISLSPNDPGALQAIVNGQVASTRAIQGLRSIRVLAGKGNDAVIVDLPGDGPHIPVKLFGGNGNDALQGGPGNDRLRGGAGSDSLDGGGGINRLDGGKQADWLFGNPHTDRIRVQRDDLLAGERQSFGLRRIISEGDWKAWLLAAAAQGWNGLIRAEADFVALATAATDGGDQVPQNLPDYSGTNTQEQGVDEADIVKTDGAFLYILSGGDLVIASAWPPEELKELSRTELDGSPQALYLFGDRLMVLSSAWRPPEWAGAEAKVFRPWFWYQPQTLVTIFDVSDRSDPKLVEETVLDGSLVDSRAVEGRVYLVVSNYFPLPRPVPIILPEPGPIVRIDTVEPLAKYRARVAADWEAEMPDYTTTTYGPDGETTFSAPIAQPPDIYVLPEPRGTDLLSVLLFDLAGGKPGPVATTTVAGTDGTVYASSENLYVASHCWSLPWLRFAGVEMAGIYKFALGTDSVPLKATGAVPGWVLNQFSMDEEDGFLRIATTSWRGDLANNVFVLGQTGNQLNIVGSLTNLGLGERLYAARFLGDRGFLVTFRVIDPLFALDLSNPRNPRLVGELEIPGYSCYLHPVGEDYLIGLGRYADPVTGRVQGVQLALFDVSDLANPTRVAVYQFSDNLWGSFSEAEWDHHAFSYFPEHETLAIPAWTDSSAGGLQVFRVNPAEGFVFLGAIDHDTPVHRSLRIGEYLYSVSDTTVKVNELGDPGVLVAELDVSASPPIWPPIVIL